MNSACSVFNQNLISILNSYFNIETIWKRMLLFINNICLSVVATWPWSCQKIDWKEKNLQSQVEYTPFSLSRGIYKACMMTLSALGSHDTAGIWQQREKMSWINLLVDLITLPDNSPTSLLFVTNGTWCLRNTAQYSRNT